MVASARSGASEDNVLNAASCSRSLRPKNLIGDSSGLERWCAGGRWRADVRRVRMRRSRFALYVRVGRGNDEWIARVVQRGNAVVEEAQCAMRAVLMMSAVLGRCVIGRDTRVMVACGIAGRMLAMVDRYWRGGVRQRQQPMPKNRQNGDPRMTTAMSEQTEHLRPRQSTRDST